MVDCKTGRLEIVQYQYVSTVQYEVHQVQYILAEYLYCIVRYPLYNKYL
jgi:hypothetical protein